jgi:transcriptional regulator with XRE-family HTH domain
MIDDRDATDIQERLASNLRRLRIARDLSLSELARAMGMSKATLSGIENARSNPTVETLAALAGALRVSLPELLEEPPLAEIRIVRAADDAFGASRDGLAQRVVDALADSATVEVAEIALDPLEVVEGGPRREGARAGIYVIEGSLIAGPVERSTELDPGDYMTFPVDGPHVYAAGRRQVRALLMTQTPR